MPKTVYSSSSLLTMCKAIKILWILYCDTEKKVSVLIELSPMYVIFKIRLAKKKNKRIYVKIYI